MEGITSTTESKKDNDADAICDFYDLRSDANRSHVCPTTFVKYYTVYGDGKKSGGSSGLSLIHARNLCRTHTKTYIGKMEENAISNKKKTLSLMTSIFS